MTDDEDIYPPPPQDISSVFVAADLLSRSSYYSAKYKRVWLMEKVICSSTFFAGECPDACSIE